MYNTLFLSGTALSEALNRMLMQLIMLQNGADPAVIATNNAPEWG